MANTNLSFRAFIGLGGNLGHVHLTLVNALEAINTLPFTSIEAVSPAYLSAPIDAAGPDYVNAVAAVQTHLAPLELLHALQALEQHHGRHRSYLNAPRTLDLDIIWMQGVAYDSAHLQLPHPRWRKRAFVVEPLADVLLMLDDMVGPILPSTNERRRMLAEQAIKRSGSLWTHKKSMVH